MTSDTGKTFYPLFTKDIVDMLDKYIMDKIGPSGEGIATLSTKNRMIRSIFKDVPPQKISIILGAYTDLARQWCHVEIHKNTNNPYYFMAYYPGQSRDTHVRISPYDFSLIKGYIDCMLKNNDSVLISDMILEDRGISLKTGPRFRWMLFNIFFGINPDYIILNNRSAYYLKLGRSENLYHITLQDRDIAADNSIVHDHIAERRLELYNKEVLVTCGREQANVTILRPSELTILDLLNERTSTFKELVILTGYSPGMISIALRRLITCGLVRSVLYYPACDQKRHYRLFESVRSQQKDATDYEHNVVTAQF